MDYTANALSTDPITGYVRSAYWSLTHNGRTRFGIVEIADLPPFPDMAAAILAAKNALGAPFIAALETEMDGPPPGSLPPMVPSPPPDSPLTVPLVPPVPPVPPPETLPPGPPLPPPGF